MAVDVLLGIVLSFVVLAALIYVTLRRAPFVFVADKLSHGLYSGADDVDELFEGPDEEGSPSGDDRRSETPEFDPSARLGAGEYDRPEGLESDDVDLDDREGV